MKNKKIKLTIKAGSTASKVIDAFKGQKEAFKEVVQSGKVSNDIRPKLTKVEAL